MENEYNWARRRQIIIIIIIVVFLILTIGGISFALLYKPATCFDTKQNQNETGIDCGGVCSKICTPDSQSLIIDWVRLFKIRDGVYSVVARVENPAVNSVALKTPYTFSLKDRDGNVVIKRSGEAFVPSHSSFVVFEGTIQTDKDPQSVLFQFDTQPNFQKSTYVQPDLAVVSKELINQDTEPRLNATVQNNNVFDVKDIMLSALIYDDAGNAVQVSQTHVDSLKAGQATDITFTWPHPISLKSQVCASPVSTSLVIDRSGSMAFLGTNPPQPLTDVKNAATTFVSELTKKDQSSIVSFANDASVDAILSSDMESIKQSIASILIRGGGTQNTNLGEGIVKGTGELLSPVAKSQYGKILVVLTDGVATRPTKKGDTHYPENYALAVAKDAKEKGIRIFTIGLGKDLNQAFLKNVASAPEDFYLAPQASDLSGIYRQIGTKMCKRLPTTLEIIPSIPPSR